MLSKKTCRCTRRNGLTINTAIEEIPSRMVMTAVFSHCNVKQSSLNRREWSGLRKC